MRDDLGLRLTDRIRFGQAAHIHHPGRQRIGQREVNPCGPIRPGDHLRPPKSGIREIFPQAGLHFQVTPAAAPAKFLRVQRQLGGISLQGQAGLDGQRLVPIEIVQNRPADRVHQRQHGLIHHRHGERALYRAAL